MSTFIRVCAAAGLAVVAVVGTVDAAMAIAPKGPPAPPPTVKVVVRPVTAAHHASPGYSVTGAPSGQVDCSPPPFPSPGAVSRNIEFCSPSSAYAVACWKAAARHHVLCMDNPRSRHLVRIRRTGVFAPTGLPPRAQRAPLEMRLGNGALCKIRDGGAWGQLPGHPKLFGTYFCTGNVAVWAKADKHWGVNESSPTWTVRTAKFTSHHLVTRRVVKAWFVGTHA
jgi:hypothetical protein